MGVDAVIAAFTVQGGTGAGEIADERFGKVGKIATAENVGELVFDPGGWIGEEDGDAVDDGVLTLAHAFGAEQGAFNDVFAVLAGDVGESQHGHGLAIDPTKRADRLDAFAVFETQGEPNRR